MSKNTYDLLTANNVDINKGKEQFDNNIDIYLIFLKKFLENEDIKDLSYHIHNENITQAVFSASALMAESKKLCIDCVSEQITKLQKNIDSNNLADARQVVEDLERSISKIKEILN